MDRQGLPDSPIGRVYHITAQGDLVPYRPLRAMTMIICMAGSQGHPRPGIRRPRSNLRTPEGHPILGRPHPKKVELLPTRDPIMTHAELVCVIVGGIGLILITLWVLAMFVAGPS